MKRFLKRICFVIPISLANIADDLVFLFSLGYANWPHLGMRFSLWWGRKRFGQY